jgi:hypothetical protein
MNMRKTLWVALAAAGLASASPITFTLSASGVSGTLNGAAFTDATITFTQVTDTADILSCGSCVYGPLASSTVAISGLGTATLEDPISFGDDHDPGLYGYQVGFQDATDSLVFWEYNPAFASYGLVAPLGPIVDMGGGASLPEPTSAGLLTPFYLRRRFDVHRDYRIG